MLCFQRLYRIRVIGISQHVLRRKLFSSPQDSKKSVFRQLQQPDKTDFNAMGYVLLIIPVAAFGLGTWQVGRRKWKLNLIEDMQKRTLAAPVPFPENLDDLEELEYRKVKVRGEYDHSQELYIMPRSPVEQESKGIRVPGKTLTGAYVVTPFHLSDSNRVILVNRGWVARDRIDPKKRQEGQVKGPVEFIGVVRHTEQRAPFSAKNDVEKNHWYSRNIEAMAAVLNTDHAFIDADRNSTVPGGPIGGQTRVTLRNEHMQYILTWYSLSAITFYMWFRSYWRRA